MTQPNGETSSLNHFRDDRENSILLAQIVRRLVDQVATIYSFKTDKLSIEDDFQFSF